MNELDVGDKVDRLHRDFRTFRAFAETELEAIKKEAMLTNGRVRMLEIAKAYADGARHAMSWTAPLAGSVLSGIVVGIVLLVAGRL